MTDFAAELAAARIVAVLRGADGPAAAAGAALLDEGVSIVEITLTTPDALRAIEKLRDLAPPGSLIGAGTVLTQVDVTEVRAAGAQFVVTPAVTESVAAAAERACPSWPEPCHLLRCTRPYGSARQRSSSSPPPLAVPRTSPRCGDTDEPAGCAHLR